MTFEEIEKAETYRNSLSTVDSEGKRIWLYPKQPKGRYHLRRNIVYVLLMAFFFSAPFIKIGEQPLLQFQVFERKFVIFGNVFWPHDFHLFLLAFISLIVFVVLFTTVYGRIFCGWACPQTVFMEGLFRKIEYWIEGNYRQQRKLAKKSWSAPEKLFKKGGKHLIFLALAFFIGNIFISYIYGYEEVLRMASEGPTANLDILLPLIVFSFLFYGVFSYMREQVCTVLCPYGRLQGVLLDKKSLNVMYDFKRGEPRAKNSKKRPETAGDCIDCKQCVDVCPTGIDIRNGVQLECINCTACIDACDAVMDLVGKPRGLVRYTTADHIEKGKTFSLFTPRIMAYTGVLVVLLSLLTYFMLSRSAVEAGITRTQSGQYIETADGKGYWQKYNLSIINKTQKPMPIEVSLKEDVTGRVTSVTKGLTVGTEEPGKDELIIEVAKSDLQPGLNEFTVVVSSEGRVLEEVEVNFLAPEDPEKLKSK